MVSPVRLVETLSAATGVSVATVIDIDRKLVAAGLRTKGGRGLHAARMTSLDAARLLTAILASPQANQSAQTVTRYSETRVEAARSSDGLYAAASLDDMAALPARHGFVDALAALIGSAATGSLAELVADSGIGGAPHIEVFAFSRATYGRIRLSGLPNRPTVQVEYLPPRDPKRGRGRGTAGADDNGDLETSSRVTERTILAVANLFAEESPDDRA